MTRNIQHRVHPHMTKRARELRKNMTHPEKVLWHLLRSRELEGLKFRRQHVIDPYIVDFYCADLLLVIEVDGESHDDPEADARRTAYLESQGLTVFRVSNDQVLKERVAVLDAILEVAERTGRAEEPSPRPSPWKGEGEGEGRMARGARPCVGLLHRGNGCDS